MPYVAMLRNGALQVCTTTMFRNVPYRTVVAPVDALARFGFWTVVDGTPDILPERSERTKFIAATETPARVVANTVQ